jgi:hypothetical protein
LDCSNEDTRATILTVLFWLVIAIPASIYVTAEQSQSIGKSNWNQLWWHSQFHSTSCVCCWKRE